MPWQDKILLRRSCSLSPCTLFFPAALNRPGQLASASQHLYRFYQIVLLHSEANLMVALVKEPLTPCPEVEYATCFHYTSVQNTGVKLMEETPNIPF